VCIKTGCRVVGVPLTDTFRLIDGRVAVAFARRLSGEEAMRLDAVARRRREAWACRRFLSCAQAPKHLAQFMEREASTWFEKVVQIRPSLILECCAKDTGVKIRRRG
jgi:hypothetical protein